MADSNIEVSLDLQLETILYQADLLVKNPENIKPSDAWKYRQTVKTKYGLPECGYMFQDPVRFIKEIEEFLQANNVNVRPKHEMQRFFKEEPDTDAVTFKPSVFRDNTIVVPQASKSEWFELRTRAKLLAHEAVHGAQHNKYPHMPYEESEREAYYYAGLTPQVIIQYQDSPDMLINRIDSLDQSARRSAEADINSGDTGSQ